MSQLLLVRHGQASWGSDDYDVLSPLGEKQAHVLGEALAARGVRPDLVVRGSLRRHRQTAEHALAGAGWDTEVLEDPGWDEFDHVQMLALHPSGYGHGEELSRAQFQAWFEEATERWVGGEHDEEYDEPFSSFGQRVEAAWRRTVERLDQSLSVPLARPGTAATGATGAGPTRTVVVFTSGGPISWVAASLLGAGPHLWTQLNPVTVNSSVTKVVVGRRGQTLVSFNEHAHLEAAGDGFITYR